MMKYNTRLWIFILSAKTKSIVETDNQAAGSIAKAH